MCVPILLCVEYYVMVLLILFILFYFKTAMSTAALDALLPTVAPPQTILINNKPLNEVLTVIANTIRQQQEEFRKFHDTQKGENKIFNQRLEALEGRVDRIEKDLKITERPIGAYGQAPAPCIFDSLSTVEYRVFRCEQKNKIQTYEELLDKTNKARAAYFLSKWLRRRHMQAAASLMMGTSFGNTRLQFFGRWKAALEANKSQRRAKRLVRSVLFVSAKSLASSYFRKWLQYRNDLAEGARQRRARNMELSDTLASLTSRGLVRKYFGKLCRYQDHVAYVKSRYHQAGRLEVANHRALAQNAYEKWEEFTNFRLFNIRRRRVITSKQKHALRTLVSRYLDKWALFVRVAPRREAKLALVGRMHHSQQMRLASRYFIKFVRFIPQVHQQRQFRELATYLTIIAKKYDSLGDQLDLGLDNLSHTNQVVSRVVDTLLLTNDAPQVQSLLSIHRGDQKLNQRFPRAAAPAIAGSVPRTRTRTPSPEAFRRVAHHGSSPLRQSPADVIAGVRERMTTHY